MFLYKEIIINKFLQDNLKWLNNIVFKYFKNDFFKTKF